MNIDESFDEQLNRKTRIVKSVYLTPKKLQIALTLLSGKKTGKEIAEMTNTLEGTVNKTLTEMLVCGVIDKQKVSYSRYYSLTKLGKKVVRLLD